VRFCRIPAVPLAHLQRRLAADVDQLARLTAELTTLHTSTAVASAGSMTSGATRPVSACRCFSSACSCFGWTDAAWALVIAVIAEPTPAPLLVAAAILLLCGIRRTQGAPRDHG
jgi:hypothetical protein